MTLTEHLTAMLKAESAATKGPWDVSSTYDGALTVLQMRHPHKQICINADYAAMPEGYKASHENAELIALSRNHFAALVRVAMAADEGMAALAEHGASIVPHLVDTDENAGERLRSALSSLTQSLRGAQ